MKLSSSTDSSAMEHQSSHDLSVNLGGGKERKKYFDSLLKVSSSSQLIKCGTLYVFLKLVYTESLLGSQSSMELCVSEYIESCA